MLSVVLSWLVIGIPTLLIGYGISQICIKKKSVESKDYDLTCDNITGRTKTWGGQYRRLYCDRIMLSDGICRVI